MDGLWLVLQIVFINIKMIMDMVVMMDVVVDDGGMSRVDSDSSGTAMI